MQACLSPHAEARSQGGVPGGKLLDGLRAGACDAAAACTGPGSAEPPERAAAREREPATGLDFPATVAALARERLPGPSGKGGAVRAAPSVSSVLAGLRRHALEAEDLSLGLGADRADVLEVLLVEVKDPLRLVVPPVEV